MQKETPFFEEIQASLQDLTLEDPDQLKIEESILKRAKEPTVSEVIKLVEKRPDAPKKDTIVKDVVEKAKEQLGEHAQELQRKENITERENKILKDIAQKLQILRTDKFPTPSGPRFTGRQKPKRPESPEKIKYIFSKKDKRQLNRFLDSPFSKFEIEASFGTYFKWFRPGFKSFPAFHYLKEMLEQKASDGLLNRTTSIEVIEIMKGIPARKIISIPSGDIVWQKKFRRDPKTGNLSMVENPQLGVRVYKSSEIFVSEADVQKMLEKAGVEEFEPTMMRLKRRTSYLDYRDKSPMKNLRFDLTIVQETNYLRGTSFVRGEVEIERKGRKATSEGMITAIQKVLEWSQRAPNFDYVIGLPERKFAVKLHNDLFWHDVKENIKDSYRLVSNYWNKPRNIKINDLLNPSMHWSVTVKLNGRRNFLLIDSYGIYLFGPPFDVIKIGDGIGEFYRTLLDGEFMRKNNQNEYHCFDILFMEGHNVRQEFFIQRQEFLKRVVKHLQTLKELDTTIYMKRFHSEGTLYKRARKALKDTYKISKEEQDGFIFQPHIWYYNKYTLKWKPPEQLTIDFKVIPDLEDPMKVNLMVGYKRGQRPFTGSQRYPLPKAMELTDDEVDGEQVMERIVEFSWDKKEAKFKPVRIRDDRDRPNNPETARDVWNDIMDPISKDTIFGDTLQVARRYFNNIKRDMLEANIPKRGTILDIGSGRGGDLLKWNKMNLKVYAVEPNEENLKEFERRIKGMKQLQSSVKLINMGAEETEGIKKILEKDKTQLSGIVSFFSLTFFTKNKKLYDSLIKTIDLLPVGGKFIGIVMDGERTRELLEKAKTEAIDELVSECEQAVKEAKSKKEKKLIKSKYEEEIEEEKKLGSLYTTRAYSIFQMSLFTDKPIGNEIEIDIHEEESMVKKQREWLVYFNPFKQQLKKLGFVHQEQPFLTDKYTSNFIDGGPIFDILPKDSQTFCSLFRVFVFTKYSKFKKFRQNVPKIGSSLRLNTPYSNELSIVGIPQTDLISATLWSLKPSIRNEDKLEKEVNKLRKDMAEDLTLEKFKTLNIAKKIKKTQLEESLNKFKKQIADPKTYISKERLLDLLEDVLDVNIYILRGTLTKDWVTSVNIVPLSYSPKEQAIILYTTDDISFYPVKRKKTFKFSSSDPLIQKFIKERCPYSFT